VHFTSKLEALEAEQVIKGISPAIIPLGIDLAPYRQGVGERFYEMYPLTRQKKILLFLSRIDPKKGIDLLLPAFAAIQADHPDAVLVIAGEGEKHYVESLKAITASFSIADRILWTGFLTGQDKLDALAAAYLFLLPSHSENFGIAAAEALAAGLPVITGKGVAISEEIKAEKAGFIAENHAIQDYAQAMREALQADLKPYREAARRLAQERYSLETMGGKLASLYQKILSHES
jgi:glycosyltransferase involved in cell wall biosynthesis